jgi:hypothetical protein
VQGGQVEGGSLDVQRLDIRPVTLRRKLVHWVDVALRSFPVDTWANAWKRILCKPEEEMSILEAAFVDHRAEILFRCQRGRAQAPESQHMEGLRFDDTCPPCEPEDAEEGEEDLFARGHSRGVVWRRVR